MLFHNSSSDSENSQDTSEVVSPASVSTAIDLLVAFVLWYTRESKNNMHGEGKAF